MPWILFLEPFTKCAHSLRIRTDTTLDQDCVLKVVSLLTTCMNSNTPPHAQIEPFEQIAEASFNKETEKARLPTDSCLNN